MTRAIDGLVNVDFADREMPDWMVRVKDDYFKGGFESAGFTVLFDEVEEHDSEVSWKGKGRTGQVALRDECGEADRTYVHITNRPS